MNSDTITKETPVTNSDEYHGWPNRETWAASLHLDNDQSRYIDTREAATALIDSLAGDTGILTDAQCTRAESLIAERIAGFFTAEADAVYHAPGAATNWGRMMAADVGSLWRVDWREIASHYVDDCAADLGVETMRDAF